MLSITNLSLTFLICKSGRKLMPTSTICKVKYSSVYKSACKLWLIEDSQNLLPKSVCSKIKELKPLPPFFYQQNLSFFFLKIYFPEKTPNLFTCELTLKDYKIDLSKILSFVPLKESTEE